MKSNLIAALEELHEDLTDMKEEATGYEGMENEITIQEAFEAFEAYTEDYRKLSITVASLEEISEVLIQNEQPENKTNYPAIIGFVNAVTSTLASDDTESLAIPVETIMVEGGDKRALALEGIGSLISRIWRAIQNFLNGVWNWFKNLSIWQKLGIVKINAKARRTEANIKIAESNQKAFKNARSNSKLKKEIEDGEITEISQLFSRIREEQRKKFAEGGTISASFKNITNAKRESLGAMYREAIQKTGLRPKTSVEAYGESDLLMQSVYGLYETCMGMDFCYNSRQTLNLLTPEILKKYSANKKPIGFTLFADGVKAYASFAESYFNFIQVNYLNSIKEAITILTKEEFDPAAAKKVITNIFPRSREAHWANGEVKDGKFMLSQHAMIGHDQVNFTFIDDEDYEDFIASIEQGKPVGKYIDKIQFTSSKLRYEEEPPLILLMEYTSIDTMKKFVNMCVDELNTIFKKTTDFSTRYQSLLQGLIKAVERASRLDGSSNTQKAIFARAVMHSTNVYVNQPLVMINKSAPTIISALCDYADAYSICFDPLTIEQFL